MRENLILVIKYLNGEIDIYNGDYENVINTWNQVWDEIKFMGYNPGSVDGIKKYISEQL